MSESGPFFVGLPWEFFTAWLVDRRLKRTHVLCAFYVAGRCWEARNMSKGVAAVELATIARPCEVGSTETIRRALHDLRAWGWLDFEPGNGGDPAWRIWLTGPSIEPGSPGPLHDLSTKSPSPAWRGLATEAQGSGSANQHREADSGSTTSPQNESSEDPKRNETKPQERQSKNLRAEEKLDHLVGQTTTTDPHTTDRLIAAVERNGTGPISVKRGEDGELVWSAEPREGEQGILEDLQTLVDAGLAEWLDEGER